MDNTFTIEAIKETRTYKELESKNERVKCNFLEQKVVRERITHAFTVWKNKGFIPNTLRMHELLVVTDLIKMQGTDRIWDMECKSEFVNGDGDND